MLRATTQVSNQIRGLMKTFGLVVPKGAGRVFAGHVRSLAGEQRRARADYPAGARGLARHPRPRRRTEQAAAPASARASEQCQLLSSISSVGPSVDPGVGAVTASYFVAAGERTVWRKDCAPAELNFSIVCVHGVERRAVPTGTRTGSFRHVSCTCYYLGRVRVRHWQLPVHEGLSCGGHVSTAPIKRLTRPAARPPWPSGSRLAPESGSSRGSARQLETRCN